MCLTRQRYLYKALGLMSLLFLSSIYRVNARERQELNGTSLKEHYVRGVYWSFETYPGLDLTGKEKPGKEFWQGVDKIMKMLANDFNVNLVWTVNIVDMENAAKVCDIAKKYGIKFLPCINPFLDLTYNGFTSADMIKDAAREAVNTLGGKSALGAYVLRDEPVKSLAKQMEIFRRALKEADPTRDAIVVTMNRDTDAYALQTGFPILCVDCYPFGADRSPNIPNPASASQGYYRTVISAHAKAAHETGKWLWVMPQVYAENTGPWWFDENKQVVIEPGTYSNWRMPTIEETRWQIWEGLRSGCKGVGFFMLLPGPVLTDDKGRGKWWDGKGAVPEVFIKAAAEMKNMKWPVANKQVRTGKGMALLYHDGTPTPQMIEVGKTFAILAGMEKLLLSLEPADFPVSFTENTFTMAAFVSSLSPSNRYIVVVNDNLDGSIKKQLFFLPHTKQVKDIVTGKILPLLKEASDNMLSASLELEPGGGTVLEVEFAKGEPGLILFEEDFSLPQMAVQTKNIVQQPVALGWSPSWSWIAQKGTGLPPNAKAVLTIDNILKPGGPTGGVLLRPGSQLDVYMNIEGNFKAAESLIVEWVDNDGKRGWLRSNNYHLPILIPRDIKDVELQLADGASVSRILLWAIPK